MGRQRGSTGKGEMCAARQGRLTKVPKQFAKQHRRTATQLQLQQHISTGLTCNPMHVTMSDRMKNALTAFWSTATIV